MPVNALVCIKQVPDTETKVKVAGDGKRIDPEGIKWIINPYDELAIEVALRLKEKLQGSVTLITAGPARCEEALRTGLAMGADKAIHVKDDLAGADGFVVARVLAKAVQAAGAQFDLILAGKAAIDDDLSIVPVALAEALNLPNVSTVVAIEVDTAGKKGRARRQIEGAEEVVDFPLPAVISVQKGIAVPQGSNPAPIHEPRYPTLPGIMQAKKKEVKPLTVAQLGLPADALKSRTKVAEMSLPPPRAAGKLIEFETPQEAAQKLIKALREEAKLLQL
ncbi:MAG: electron transfer flavoprotein subunit beta/FixA family protein [Halobacteria archaeon]